MAQRRKYKFNWLDRLYYMGVNYVPDRWPMPFEALIYSILMWPFVFIMILLYKRDEPVIGLLFVVCMGLFFHFYDWPLKKFLFTSERERAYFRRYPQRKNIKYNTLWWLSLVITATNVIAIFLVLYLLSR